MFAQEDKVDNVVSFLFFLVTDQIIKGASFGAASYRDSVLRVYNVMKTFENFRGMDICYENFCTLYKYHI